MAMLRESFSRAKEYVAVKRIRLTSVEFIEPGQKIDKSKHKLFQLMRWYKMRRIGVEGSMWSEEMLKVTDKPHARPEVTHKPVADDNHNVVKRTRRTKAQIEADNLKASMTSYGI